MAAERVIRDQYDEMTGPVLVAELGKRELNVSGKVEELRDRLREDDVRRAEKAEADKNDPPQGEETGEDASDVPEPRKPADYGPMVVILNEDQARVLNASEAGLKRHFRYVTPMASRKYAEGDRVTGIADWANNVCRVLPFGIEIELDSDQRNED